MRNNECRFSIQERVSQANREHYSWLVCKAQISVEETPKLSLEHVTIGAKRGRPLLLSDDLDFKLRSFLTNLRSAGGTKKQTCFVWCSHKFHKKRSFKIWAIFGVLRYRWLGAILVYQVYQDRLHTQNSDHFPTPVITVVVLVYHTR